ncbi:PP2C family protein-serine/threonine phosphatase [Curtobacterium sp. B8]|uniref:PP2C family protein-serine/threonine phosphatase n=1 Tax=Curtobacterium sp. B8 TaxID=95611 RepID=UPI00034CCECA|nr:PP2C family protein-serine/threonine phosphatase [Curtobacterium sp. B8]
MGLLQDLYDDEDAGLDQTARLRSVQAAFRPVPVDTTGWTSASASRAAAGVSGDLAEIVVAPDGRSATLTLGDVMGKGTPAGLLAANLLGALDALARENPAVAVEGAENAVRARFERASAFATLFHARVRLADGAVEFVDAGHGFAAIGHADGRTERIASVDLPIGLQPRGFARLPRHVDLGPGDVLVCASDGILELPDATFDTLTDLAARLVAVPTLTDGLAAFMASAPERVDDDLTLVALRREHGGAGRTTPDGPEGSTRR